MVNEWKIKEEICEIGRRIYAKGFAAANDGNISYRLNEKEVLCSPTQICKGFMKPDDICKVDMTGKQIAGHRKRTSEVLLHLEIYKLAPDVKSVVHCHPPYATAFALAGEEIPTCILPEVEVFLGTIPTTDYETPGCPEFADKITPFVHKAKVAVLKNHGTVSWGETLEKAYWWTEILDAYCRMLVIAKDIGKIERISTQKVEELLDLKEKFGVGVDPRRLENADLCVNVDFGRGYADKGDCGCPTAKPAAMTPPEMLLPKASTPSIDELERVVQVLTDQVMAAL